MENFKSQFPLLFQQLNSPEMLNKCYIMHQELVKFNKKLNLISPASLKIVESVHFLDSVMGIKLILKHSPSLSFYDVGSGNGFPGLILASLAPKKFVNLVESDSRKAEFIDHCAFKMKLNNVEVICERVENLKLQSPPVFVSRAFAAIDKSLELYSQASSKGFEAYHFKSARWQSEVLNATPLDQNVPHGTITDKAFVHKAIGQYQLPHNSQYFSIIHSSQL